MPTCLSRMASRCTGCPSPLDDARPARPCRPRPVPARTVPGPRPQGAVPQPAGRPECPPWRTQRAQWGDAGSSCRRRDRSMHEPSVELCHVVAACGFWLGSRYFWLLLTNFSSRISTLRLRTWSCEPVAPGRWSTGLDGRGHQAT